MNELLKFEELIDKFFKETSKEQIRIILKKYDDLKFEGVNIKTYLKSLSNELLSTGLVYEEFTNQQINNFNDFLLNEGLTVLSEHISFSCQPETIEINTNYSSRYSEGDDNYRIAA
jgi:hypothetical protein